MPPNSRNHDSRFHRKGWAFERGYYLLILLLLIWGFVVFRPTAVSLHLSHSQREKTKEASRYLVPTTPVLWSNVPLVVSSQEQMLSTSSISTPTNTTTTGVSRSRRKKGVTATPEPEPTIELYQIPVVPVEGLGNFLDARTTEKTPSLFEEDATLPRVLDPKLLVCPFPAAQLPENMTMQHSVSIRPLKCEPVALPRNETPLRLPPLWEESFKTSDHNEDISGARHNEEEKLPCLSWDCAMRDNCLANAEGYCYRTSDSINAVHSHPVLELRVEEKTPVGCNFREPSGGGLTDELSCAWAPDPDQPPTLPSPETTSDKLTKAERTLQAFKNFTANSFQKWYDWGSPEEIIEMKTSDEREDFVARASHRNKKEKVFVMKNICIRPTGSLAGYKPVKTTASNESKYNIGPYEGGDDVKSKVVNREPFITQPTQDFFSSVEELTTPPEFYMNRRLAFMPLTSRSNNPGHALQRLGGLMANIEMAFGREKTKVSKNDSVSCDNYKDITVGDQRPLGMSDGARRDVTTVYAFISAKKALAKFYNYCSPNCTFQDFSFTQYTTLATTTHFIIWNNPAEVAANQPWASPEKFRGEGESVFTPNNTMLCFKEAVVYQACHLNDCKKSRMTDVKRHIFGLYYGRSAAVQVHLARRLRNCAMMQNSSGRPFPKTNGPTVLYAFRDRSRGLSMGAYQVQEMKRVVEKIKGHLYLSDMSRLTTWEMVRLYSQADILIGPYGAGLYFMFLMPPKAVTIEINTAAFRQSKLSGIDQNPNSDYGGMAVAADGYHLVCSPQGTVGRYPKGWIHISPKLVERQLIRAQCVLGRHNRSQAEIDCGTSNPRLELVKYQLQQAEDLDGLDLRRTVRALHSPSFQLPRPGLIHTLYSFSQLIARAFMPQRFLVNRRMLVAIGDCGPRDYQHFYHFWMNYQSMSSSIYWVVGKTNHALQTHEGDAGAEGFEMRNETQRVGDDDDDEVSGGGNAEDFNEAKGGKRISSAVSTPPFKNRKDIIRNIRRGDRMRRQLFKICQPELNGRCSTLRFPTIVVTKKYLRSQAFATYLSKNAGGFNQSRFLQALHNNASEPLPSEKLDHLHTSGELNYDMAALIRELPINREQSNAKIFILDDA